MITAEKIAKTMEKKFSEEIKRGLKLETPGTFEFRRDYSIPKEFEGEHTEIAEFLTRMVEKYPFEITVLSNVRNIKLKVSPLESSRSPVGLDGKMMTRKQVEQRIEFTKKAMENACAEMVARYYEKVEEEIIESGMYHVAKKFGFEFFSDEDMGYLCKLLKKEGFKANYKVYKDEKRSREHKENRDLYKVSFKMPVS